MSRQLNLTKIQKNLKVLGLNQANLANQIGVTRSILSQWLKGDKFPRPRNVLKLSRILNMDYEELVIEEFTSQPIVAFRKRGNAKTTEIHKKKALAMGNLLKELAPLLPYDTLSIPPILKNPNCDYSYIQKVAHEVRRTLSLTSEIIDFDDLINCFNSLKAVIIPVLWGHKKGMHNHENALNIYLPDSQTNWIYLNLQTNIHDFKFWMAHELGHAKAPNLIEDEGEEFADKFAGALLFPKVLAEEKYQELYKIRSDGKKITSILNTADKFTISPYTVLTEVNNYANACGREPLVLNIGGATTNFNKGFKLLSDWIFDSPKPHPGKYLKFCEKFNSPFFEALSKYLKEHEKSASFISEVLNVSLIDAKAIFTELS